MGRGRDPAPPAAGRAGVLLLLLLCLGAELASGNGFLSNLRKRQEEELVQS